MPKRRKKRRGKRREPQQQLPRPSREGEQPLRPDAVLPTTAQAERAATSSSLDENHTGEAADRAIVATVSEVEREFIWIETEGTRAKLYASELMLDIGEVPADRYAPGDRFEAFVFQMGPDPNSGAPQFSIRRAAPYLNALSRLKVGSVVANATVVNTYDVGIELDVDGLRGNAFIQDLQLASDESPHDRYQPGDTIPDLFVWQVDHDFRDLALSVRRNAPDYIEALNAHSVGDVVSATVTAFQGNSGLWLEVDGVVGRVGPQDLSLADGESAQDRYAVGDPVHDLFLWQVNHDSRNLYLSARRNAPGYVDALNAHRVGEVVSATVTDFGGRGLWLDVDGAVGWVGPQELSLADGETAQDRYAVGDPIHNLVVWQVDHDARDLSLSARRNAPGYVDALNAHSVGDVVSGIIAIILPGGLWLDVDGTVGWIFKEEALLEEGETLAERYTDGDSITAVVQHIDRQSRTLLLSARRIASARVEELIVQGATIQALVVRKRDGGIDVSVGGESEIYVPDYALSLRLGGSPDLEPGQEIDVAVMDVKDGVPTVLSRRRALDGWEAARDRLAAEVVVPNARIIPWADRPNHDGRAAIDLGPITGFIPLTDRDAEAAQDLMSRRANTRLGIMIEELDKDTWTASVSEAKFKARWQELVDALPTNEGIEGEIIDMHGGLRRSISAVVCWGRCQ